MRKSQRHTQFEMFSHVEACKKGTQAQKGYCQQHSIAYSTFQYWVKKYRNEFDQNKADDTSGFIPVQVQPDPEQSSQGGAGVSQLHFLYPNGIQVMCSEGVHPEVLKTLINS